MIRPGGLARRLLSYAVVSGVLLACPCAFAHGDESSLRAAQTVVFQAAIEKARQSIVRIETIGGAQPVREEEGETRAAGFRTADGPTTGVIWSADGLILSSTFNFVRDPSIITVTLADDRRFVARLLARDQQSRLALLKVEAAGLPAATWKTPAQLRPGQWTIAAGFGHGSRTPAVSLGIISGLPRMSGQAIQTDAKLSPVNYGGPLIDIDGDCLGICVPIGLSDDEFAEIDKYDSGIGFAVHIDQIRRRVDRLARGENLHRGLLGVVFDLRDPVVGGWNPPPSKPQPGPPGFPQPPATQPQPRAADGLRITAPPSGPAAAAGLAEGDVVIAVDDLPTIRIVDFRRAIALKAAGDEVELRYRRGEATHTAKVRLASAEDFRARPASQPASQPASAPAP